MPWGCSVQQSMGKKSAFSKKMIRALQFNMCMKQILLHPHCNWLGKLGIHIFACCNLPYHVLSPTKVLTSLTVSHHLMNRKLSRCFEWCTLHRDPGATSFRSTVVSLAPLLPCKECLRSRSPKTPRAPARAWWSTPGGACGKVVAIFDLYSSGIISLFPMIRFSMSPGSWKTLDDSERSNHLHTENLMGSTEWVSKNHLEIAALAGHPRVSHWYSIGPISHHRTNWKNHRSQPPTPNLFFGIHLVTIMTNQ